MINRVIVSTDCVCDLPANLIEKYSIPIMYYYMQVGEARFQDTNEIDSDSILEYMEQDNKMIATMSATVQEYRSFFERITDGGKENVIHISLAKRLSNGYQNALEAAKDFPTVRVVDSGKISSAMGLMVLIAADLARKGATKDIILQKLDQVRDKINCSFIMRSTKYLVYNHRWRTFFAGCMETMAIHPIVTVRNSALSIGGVAFGKDYQYARDYINARLRNKDKISNEVLFVVIAGCDYDMQQYIVEEVKKQMDWRHICVLKASATISCNSGSGTFSLTFLNK